MVDISRPCGIFPSPIGIISVDTARYSSRARSIYKAVCFSLTSPVDLVLCELNDPGPGGVASYLDLLCTRISPR